MLVSFHFRCEPVGAKLAHGADHLLARTQQLGQCTSHLNCSLEDKDGTADVGEDVDRCHEPKVGNLPVRSHSECGSC